MTMLIKKVHILDILFVVLLFSLGSESVREDANTIVRCIENERQALLMFKRGTIDKSGVLSSWRSEEDKKDCCKWNGVTCSDVTGHVTNLDLLNVKHVSIKMTSSLIELKSLKYLILQGNDFGSMSLPNFIGSLTSLVSLDLRDSNLGGPIPYQLGNLSNLESLILSSNNFVSNPIPEFIGSFTKLEYLDLSNSSLSGPIPYQLKNLSNLKYLDLRDNEGLYVKDLEWLSGLSSLKDLDLNGVDLSRANGWVNIIKALPFLSDLNLGDCNLSRVITPSLSSANSSSSIFNLVLSSNDLTFSTSYWLFNLSSSLVDLDLSRNLLKGSIPNAFGTLCNLKYLRLGWNNLSGGLEDFSSGCAANSLAHNQFTRPLIDFKGWPSLKGLDLSNNQLVGRLVDFKGWSSLEWLSLFNNQLTGPIPVFRECPYLEILLLAHNQFTGPLIDFKGWPSLKQLYLSNNQLTGTVPVFRECSSLEELDLSYNQFSALLPETFGQLLNLQSLDISKNSLQVVITKEHFSNLSNLRTLDLSFNTNISFNWSSQHVSPLQLDEFYMRSCKLGPRFPEWIKTQKSLQVLDLSNNEISDSIPTWFWDLTGGLIHLNLSSNNIRGILPNTNSSLFEIDLSSNNLEGPIPSFLSNGYSLNLSKNKFSGTLSFLQAPRRGNYLQYLDVSHNHLLGEIPDCWVDFKDMIILNLAYNNLSGGIPSSLGFLLQLQVLDLYSNMLSRELPMSLRNCTQLRFLNLGANKFSGYIPAWMGEISKLYVLIIRSNEFLGSIPLQLCQLQKLQFFDLSTNNISGKIPGCFNNLTGMIRQPRTQSKVVEHQYNSYLGDDGYNPYYDRAPVVWKGGEREFGKNLGYVVSIDLSSNKLSGELPETIFTLLELVSLSISNNDIYGNIPLEIGNLKKLESLNLSNNRLSGEIPESMSYLTFLNYLDLSNNNLSGKIPTSTQLQSFNASTYTGNYALCGAPLVQKCEQSQVPSIPASNEEGKDEFDRWFYIGAALGFSTTFWGICVALFLNRRWRHAYFLFLYNLKDWIYVALKVYVAQLRRI